MKLVLDVTAGPHQGKRFEFDQHETFLVGRAPEAHLQLADDAHFSRNHFLLECNPPRCLLRDLKSRNGTFVNGHRVESYYLIDGDVISGGRTKMRYSVVRAPGEEPPLVKPPSGAGLAAGDVFQPVPGYVLGRKLGEGKMGVVYHARHAETGRDYALKVITPESSASQMSVNRFLREVDVLRDLHHPRIVNLHDAGTASGLLYFVMDYVDTIDVREVLHGHSPAFQVRTYCAILTQVLEGLAYAHAQGYVHRDVKPGNVLLSRLGETLHVKVADFGLAKNYSNAGLSGMTMEGELLGTCAFMPPEQVLHARDAKPAADIYSSGASLYFFLARDYPHAFRADRHPLATVLEEEPVPLTSRAPHVPPGLADVVHRALARRPDQRFASAEDMRRALLPFTARRTADA